MASLRIAILFFLVASSRVALKCIASDLALKGIETDILQSQKLIQLINQIYQEKAFETLVIYRSNERGCCDEIDLLLQEYSSSLMPCVLLTDNTKFILKNQYNKNILTLCCLQTRTCQETLKNLAESLKRMRSSNIIFILQSKADFEGMEVITQLFHSCNLLQMLNVVAIFDNFLENNDLFSFRKFPEFQLEQWSFRNDSNIFPNRLLNHYGYAMRTVLVNNIPAAISYINKYGQPQRIGYLVTLVETYAERLNATLINKQTLDLGKFMEPVLLAYLTYSYHIDLPMLLATPAANMSLDAFSEIVEVTSWMPMLPRADVVPLNNVIIRIIQSYSYLLVLHIGLLFCYALLHSAISTYLPGCRERLANFHCTDIMLNDRIVRGILGFSFNEKPSVRYQLRLIYMLVFIQGLVVNTMFNAYLHTFITHRPMLAQLNSFDDLKSSGTKILIPNSDLQLLGDLSPKEFMQQYRDIFLPVRNQIEFHVRCQKMDTKYAYAMRSSSWRVFETQQRSFGRKLFRISDDVYFRDFMLLAIPLTPDNIYRESFNHYLLEVRAAGLWHHWTERAFYDMVKAGQLNFTDASNKHGYRAMCVMDFYWFWLGFVVAMILSSAVLLCELLLQKFEQRYEK